MWNDIIFLFCFRIDICSLSCLLTELNISVLALSPLALSVSPLLKPCTHCIPCISCVKTAAATFPHPALTFSPRCTIALRHPSQNPQEVHTHAAPLSHFLLHLLLWVSGLCSQASVADTENLHKDGGWPRLLPISNLVFPSDACM